MNNYTLTSIDKIVEKLCNCEKVRKIMENQIDSLTKELINEE